MGAIDRGVSAKLKQRKTPSVTKVKQGIKSSHQKTLLPCNSIDYGLSEKRNTGENQAEKLKIQLKIQ
jgi:hypothetical protein